MKARSVQSWSLDLFRRFIPVLIACGFRRSFRVPEKQGNKSYLLEYLMSLNNCAANKYSDPWGAACWLRDAMQGLLCFSHPQPRKTATSAEATLPKQAQTVPAARRMVLVNPEQEDRKNNVLSRLPAGTSGHGGRVYLFNCVTQGFNCICFSASHTQNFRKSQAPGPQPSDSVSVALRWDTRIFRLQKVLFQMWRIRMLKDNTLFLLSLSSENRNDEELN